MLLLGTIAAAWAGAWAPLGPIPDGHRLLSESVGPDLVRFEWESPELSHYWIDLTPDRGGSALCTGGGLSLQLRQRLDDAPESFDLPSLPAPIAAACAALPRAAPLLRGGMLAATPANEPPLDQNVTAEAPGRVPMAGPRPWHAVVVAWATAAVVALVTGGRARPLGWTLALAALASGARLAWARETVILGGDAAYERLISALGRGGTDRYYGETWMSLLGLIHEGLAGVGLVGTRPAELAHDVNLVASSASPPLLFVLARRLGLGERPALLAGVGLALWPHAVGLSRIEDHAVLVGFLQLLTAVAALGGTRSERALAVLSAALLAHLRPDPLPVAALLLLALAARRQWGWSAAGAVLIGCRLAYLPERSGGSPIDFARLLRLGDWPFMLRAWLGAGGAMAPALVTLSAFGASLAVRRRPGLPPRPGIAWLALVLAATTLPYLPKDLPAADPLRFSLPADSWLVLLATIGLIGVRRGHWSVGAGLATVAAIATVALRPGATTAPRPWAWEREYQFLRASLPRPEGDSLRAPDGAVRGWYDDGQDPNGAFRVWLSVSTGMRWSPWGAGTPSPGDLVFRGTADRLAAHWSGERCGLDVLQEIEVAPLSDGWVEFGDAPVRLSLYRVRDCDGR